MVTRTIKKKVLFEKVIKSHGDSEFPFENPPAGNDQNGVGVKKKKKKCVCVSKCCNKELLNSHLFLFYCFSHVSDLSCDLLYMITVCVTVKLYPF